MRAVPGRLHDDKGFTIVEMMLALSLLAVTMAAMGPFFVRSFGVVGQQRAQQAAIELASGAIEQVRALKGSSLLSGRSEAKSTGLWQEAYDSGPEAIKSYLAVPGRTVPANVTRKLTMKLAWDPLADVNAGDDAAISTLPQQVPLGTTMFTRSIFVGECNVYMMNLPGYLRSSGDCVNPDIVLEPGATDLGILRFFRVVVLIAWTDRNCAAGRCSHIASTLISRAPEPTFNSKRPPPELFDQTAVFYVGLQGDYELKALGGQLPNVWAMVDPLPAGLSLNATSGIISGKPQTAGKSTKLLVKVTDQEGRSVTQAVLTVNVLPATSVTVPTDLRDLAGAAVTQKLVIAGGAGPYEVRVKGLPPGLTTDLVDGLSTGTVNISGAVTTPGTYKVTVDVADAAGGTTTASYTHLVFSPVQLVPLSDRTINLGSVFTATAVAVGGDSTYKYSATMLPLGVTINPSTGVLSGLPTIPGSYLPTVTVEEGLGSRASDTFVLVVSTSTALNLTSPGDQTTAEGDAVDLDLQSNAGPLGLAPTFSATGLPDGLHLNENQGRISGKPKTPGTYLVTVTATNVLPPQSSIVTFVWTIT